MNQTVLKVHTSLQIVRQSGDEFLFKELHLGTKNQIRKFEVGACYFASKVARTKAYELVCDTPDDVMSTRDDIYAVRASIKDYLTSLPSGMKTKDGQSLTIADLLDWVHNRDNDGNKVIKVSPYSIQIKVTMQHIVPKDVELPFKDRYHENSNWFSSSTQVLEVRVPLVNFLDSNEKLDEIFRNVTNILDQLDRIDHTSQVARPTIEVIKGLIGEERLRKIVDEKKASCATSTNMQNKELELLFNNHSEIQDFNNNPELNRS